MPQVTITPRNPTTKQLKILNYFYRFRFANTDLLAQSLYITRSTAQRRLQTMLDKGYIGRIYEHSYRLTGRPAIYFMLPAGLEALRYTSPKYNSRILRNMKKDATATLGFMHHCLAVFAVYCRLRKQYDDKLEFFTQNQLADIEYFPKPLPDAHIQIRRTPRQEPVLYFLDVLHQDQPFFKATRRVKQYITYAEQSVWPPQHEFPKILLVCDAEALEKRLTKKMSHAIKGVEGEDPQFFIATQEELTNNVWHDMADLGQTLALEDIL